jgi:hypothetical protein
VFWVGHPISNALNIFFGKLCSWTSSWSALPDDGRLIQIHLLLFFFFCSFRWVLTARTVSTDLNKRSVAQRLSPHLSVRWHLNMFICGLHYVGGIVVSYCYGLYAFLAGTDTTRASWTKSYSVPDSIAWMLNCHCMTNLLVIKLWFLCRVWRKLDHCVIL